MKTTDILLVGALGVGGYMMYAQMEAQKAEQQRLLAIQQQTQQQGGGAGGGLGGILNSIPIIGPLLGKFLGGIKL